MDNSHHNEDGHHLIPYGAYVAVWLTLRTMARARDDAARTGRPDRLRDALGRFDEAAVFTIHGFCQRTLRENAAWEELFTQLGVEPYRLSYEELCADFEGALTGVLEYLDVDPRTVDVQDAVQAATGYFRPQRDAVNEEWRRGYRSWLRQRAAERAAAAVPGRVAR